MKIIIAGGRDFSESYEAFEGDIISFLLNHPAYHSEGLTEVIHGCCPTGADAMAQDFIEQYGLTATHFPADWKQHGRGAGPIRNSEMANAGADLLIAFWDGESRGTADIIRKCELNNITTNIVRY